MKQIIFGAGKFGRKYISEYADGCEILAIADNNSALWGDSLFGHPIVSPMKIKTYDYDKIVIAINDHINAKGCEAVEVMLSQLGNMGIEASKITIMSIYSPKHLKVDFVQRLSIEINQRNLEGSVAECGVSRGFFAQHINSFFPNRKLYLFDSFAGFEESQVNTEQDIAKEWVNVSGQNRHKRANTSIVMQRMEHPKNVVIKQGFVPETFAGLDGEQFVFVNLDMDLYVPQLAALRYFSPRMVRGGVILLHDYYAKQLPGVKQAVDEFAKECSFTRLPIGDKCSIALVIHRISNLKE